MKAGGKHLCHEKKLNNKLEVMKTQRRKRNQYTRLGKSHEDLVMAVRKKKIQMPDRKMGKCKGEKRSREEVGILKLTMWEREERKKTDAHCKGEKSRKRKN